MAPPAITKTPAPKSHFKRTDRATAPVAAAALAALAVATMPTAPSVATRARGRGRCAFHDVSKRRSSGVPDSARKCFGSFIAALAPRRFAPPTLLRWLETER